MLTEKNYGGSSNIPKGKLVVNSQAKESHIIQKKEKDICSSFSKADIENYRRAGKISKEVSIYARLIIKKGIKLLDIAEKIENKIIELGGRPAFPCNLSINEIAAHYTPNFDDDTKAHGLLKVDFGVHVAGCIVDTAFSIDLENTEENKKLIQASEHALNSAIENAKKTISEIGRVIHSKITTLGFSPIRNLSGHELGKFIIHAGVTIPNYDNGNKKILEQGVYAIEPFATRGVGLVYDSKPSGIYRLEKKSGVRDPLARKILEFIEKEYITLPFCSRWIIKQFGARAKLSLSILEQQGILHNYPQLVEKNRENVSQAEHTIIITDKIEILS